MNILRVDKLCVKRAGRTILRNVAFTLDEGEFLAVIGPNGSGKTTMLRAIGGTLQRAAGEIRIDGRDISQLGARRRAAMVGIVSQENMRPAGHTVMQLTLMGRFPWLGWNGMYGSEDVTCAQRAIEDAGLAGFADRLAETLSGGEWKRALLARALAQTCGQPRPLLLLDEISAGLDPASALEIFMLLEKRRQTGFGLIVALHECNLAAIFATHILGLKNGTILFHGRTKDVFTAENLSALYDLPMGIQQHPDLEVPQVYTQFASAFRESRGNDGYCRMHGSDSSG